LRFIYPLQQKAPPIDRRRFESVFYFPVGLMYEQLPFVALEVAFCFGVIHLLVNPKPTITAAA
jgi:hypothetical protein